MTSKRHRVVELPSSSSRRAGRCRSAALVAALAVLMLSTAPAVAAPSFNSERAAPRPVPGTLINAWIKKWFANRGTNPRYTDVSPSPTEYFNAASTRISASGQIAYYQVKTAAELNALDSPPPNPLTAQVTLTMTNDEGHTASGTISLQTTWAKAPPPPGPTLKVTTQQAPAGVTASAFASSFFDNAGTNAHFTDATFSTMDYYDADQTGVSSAYFTGMLDVRAKTSDELNAMSPPPPNPFTVQVTVTMTNDEGETATGTVDYVTDYETTDE